MRGLLEGHGADRKASGAPPDRGFCSGIRGQEARITPPSPFATSPPPPVAPRLVTQGSLRELRAPRLHNQARTRRRVVFPFPKAAASGRRGRGGGCVCVCVCRDRAPKAASRHLSPPLSARAVPGPGCSRLASPAPSALYLATLAGEQPVVVAGHFVPADRAQLVQVLVVGIIHHLDRACGKEKSRQRLRRDWARKGGAGGRERPAGAE